MRQTLEAAGTVKITSLGESGRAAVANRLGAGDVCSLMVLSTLGQSDYPAQMTADTPVTAVLVPKSSSSWGR